MSDAQAPSAEPSELQTIARRATAWMWINIAIAVVGVLISVGSYAEVTSSETGGTYGILWGAVVFGTWFAIKNGITAAKANGALRNAVASDRGMLSPRTPRQTRSWAARRGTVEVRVVSTHDGVTVQSAANVTHVSWPEIRMVEAASLDVVAISRADRPTMRLAFRTQSERDNFIGSLPERVPTRPDHGSAQGQREPHPPSEPEQDRATGGSVPAPDHAKSDPVGQEYEVLGFEPPRVLVRTSASFAAAPWAARPELENGWLEVLASNGARQLSFRGRQSGLLSLAEGSIVATHKAASGLNVVVDVEVHSTQGPNLTVCFSGPKGRMTTAFAALGHPI